MTRSLAGRLRSKPTFFWITLLLGAILLGLYVFVGVMIARYGALYRDLGWVVARRDGKWVVTNVTPHGPAEGKLQVGDVLLAITNDHIRSNTTSPGSNAGSIMSRRYDYALDVLRGTQKLRLELESGTYRDEQRPVRKLAIFAAGLGFYLVGLVLGLAKPEDRLTRRAALTLLVYAGYQLYQSLNSNVFFTFWECVGVASISLGYPLQFALAYSFYYRFPRGAPGGRFWTALEYLLYLWGGVLCLLNAWWCLHLLQELGLFAQGLARSTPFILAAILAMCAVIARNYRSVKEPDQRRRIKWVIYGSIVGIVPGLLILTYRLLFQKWNQLSTIGDFMPVAIPLSVGYAVLKHRAFDVNVVIRRGLQHLFAKQALRLILALPLAALIWTIIVNRNRPLSAILTGNPLLLLLIAGAGLSLKFRRQLMQSIDRRFFREAYNREHILLNLIEKIKDVDSMAEVSRLVSEQVEAAMHPERLYVFYREQEKRDLTLGYSSGGQSRDLTIREGSELLWWMERQRRAQDFPPQQHGGLPEAESDWLGQLGVTLIVPMNAADSRLAGLLLLGEKKSEEPYAPTDRQLLEAIAAQMAVVYENSWLKEQAAKEQKIKHEVLERLEKLEINLVKECPACGTCYDSTNQVCAKDQRELTLSLPVERTIDGKYRLEQMIGRGGMGAVYEASDLRLNRRVAVKIMLGSMFGDRAALRRFEREAQASARLNHPNIITLYDYGSIRSDGAYLVMELLRGPTLRSELQRVGALEPHKVAVWFAQLLDAIEAAHQAGITHRDLKPENVLIASQAAGEQIKVLDFGLAKIRQVDVANTQSFTTPGTVMGTFEYMSPEQITGQEVDERSDIFSLGVMAVEALTGRRPFVGRTATDLIAAILNASFHLPGEAPQIVALDGVLQKCLAKDREQRFASVAAMKQELIPAIERCPAYAAAAGSTNATMISGDATTT